MLAEIIPEVAGMDSKRWTYKPRPSQAGPERCKRAMVYHALGIEAKPLPGRSVLVMDDSSWHEDLSIDWINKSAYKVHSQQMGLNCLELKSPFLKKEHICKGKNCGMKVPANMIHGHIDGIVKELTNIEHLFEHKAVSTRSFEAFETGEVVPYDYVAQCCMYEIELRRLLEKDLSYTILLIKNKNNARYMEYHISYDDQEDIASIEINIVVYVEGHPQLEFVREAYMENVVKGIIYKFQEVDKYYLEKKLPKRQYDIDSWHCDYCGWSEYCLKEYAKEIENRKDKIELSEPIIKAIIDMKARISKERLSLEKQEKKIKEETKIEMFEKNGKLAVAGGWLVELNPATSTKLNKELIPKEILKKATTETLYEKLNFKKIKIKEEY